MIIPVAGGEPREVMRLPSEPAAVALTNFSGGLLSMLTWAPDSRSFLIRKRLPGENQIGEVWQAFLDGNEPRKLDERMDPRLAGGGPRLHPDGRQIAFVPAQEPTGQASSAEVWVLENFLPAAKSAK